MPPAIPKKGTGKVVREGHTAGVFGTDPTATGSKRTGQEATDLK